jgi:hypothetical protein
VEYVPGLVRTTCLVLALTACSRGALRDGVNLRLRSATGLICDCAAIRDGVNLRLRGDPRRVCDCAAIRDGLICDCAAIRDGGDPRRGCRDPRQVGDPRRVNCVGATAIATGFGGPRAAIRDGVNLRRGDPRRGCWRSATG